MLNLIKNEDFTESEDIWSSITAGFHNVMLLKVTDFTNAIQVCGSIHITCHHSILIPEEMMFFKHGGVCQYS